MLNRVEMIRFLVSRGDELDRCTVDAKGVELSTEDAGPIRDSANTPPMGCGRGDSRCRRMFATARG